MPTGDSRKKSVNGRNDYVIGARTAASDAHSLWRQWNKPIELDRNQLTQRSRAQYNNNNNNNNNLRLLGFTSNSAINTVQHPPRRAALYTEGVKPA